MRLRLLSEPTASPLLPAMLVVLLTALAGCGGASGRGPQDGADTDGPGDGDVAVGGAGRLGSDVLPQRYALDLSIDPSREGLFGIVRIEVDLARRTDEVFLHGVGLDVREASVRVTGDEPVEARWETVGDQGLARLALPQPVGPGAAMIRIKWSVPFSKGLRGAYKVEVDGEAYVFTQFEPLAARTVFPCFDEPRFKTPYDVSLTVRPEHVAVSNAPEVSDVESVNDRKRVRFARTRPLPTYLVAFAVGPLDVVESEIPPNDVRGRPVPFRGLTVRGAGAGVSYALEQTPVLLSALETYFGTGYPYEKLDVVAVPDFGAGAMENAGLITFRDTLLLFDQASMTGGHKMRFAGTMAHELAHQWFGNQVTLAWWNDIWLNEGFATWVESKATEAWSPRDEPRLHDRLWIMEAMRTDGLSSARSVRQPIEGVHDIYNAFDAITYGKGAGILAMFERWLGADTFRDGVRRYLRANRRTGVATSEDFFESLSAVSGNDVAAPMETFLDQPGMPYIDVQLVCDDQGARAIVSQSRYRPTGSELADARWQIPVCLRYEGGRTCGLVTEPDQALTLEGVDGCPRWIHPDADGEGYYAWALPAQQLRDLRRRGYEELTASERLSLVGSLVTGFRSGRMPASDVLNLLPRFADDESRPVAVAPMGTLAFVAEHLVPEDDQATWRRYARGLYDKHHERLGFEVVSRRETSQAARLRADVVAFLADVADQRSVRNEAVRYARALTGFRRDDRFHLDAVAPDLYGTVLVLSAEIGNAAWFAHLEKMFERAEDPLLRQYVLRALSSFRTGDLADRSRRLVFDDRLRQNERVIPLATQLADSETRADTWDFVRDEWDALSQRLSPYLLSYMPRLVAGFCSATRAEELATFFGPKVDELPGGPRSLAQALEEVRLCAASREAQRESVTAWLTERAER